MLCNFCKPLPVHILIILVYLSKCILIFFSSCSVIVHDTQYLSYNTLLYLLVLVALQSMLLFSITCRPSSREMSH